MEFSEYKERAGDCAACGNSPVNHTSTKVFQTYNVLSGIVWKHIASTKFIAVSSRYVRYLSVYANRLHYFLARMLGIVHFGTDVTKANSYRSQVVWEEAVKRGLRMEQIYIFNKPIDVYRVLTKKGWFYFESLPIPSELPHENYGWFDDKFLLKKTLSECGVSVPMYMQSRSIDDMLTWAAALKAPIVTKPRIGSRGRHTTTNLHTEKDISEGFASARELCAFVVAEECLMGPVCRATLVQHTLVGFLAAYPPTIVGDGEHTIAELVALQNANRKERVGEITLTDEHMQYLKRQRRDMSSVPDRGEHIPLIQRTGRLFGGSTEELLAEVHPKLRIQMEKAAKRLNVPIVGFDIIIADPRKDPDTVRWGVIEANSLPFIDLHYLPLYGKPSPVASSVWDLWDGQL